MFNERVHQNNLQRSRHFKALKLAVRQNDEQAIEREIKFLSIRSYNPEQVGFSVDDLYHHVENIVVALNGDGDKRRGLRSVYGYKQAQLLRLRKLIGGGVGVKKAMLIRRDSLSDDVKVIGQKLRYYERILTIVNEQLKSRGIVVEPSGTLVTNYVNECVHA